MALLQQDLFKGYQAGADEKSGSLFFFVMAAITPAHREVEPLASDDHPSVDGTMIKTWASIRSLKLKVEATSSNDEGSGNPNLPARLSQ